MNSTTLYAEKARLIQSILNDIDDETVIEKLKAIISEAVKYPARMTIEELKIEVMQSVDDAKKELGTPQDEFFKEMDKW